MKRYIEKWYIVLMLMRIARHNAIREKFEKKYEDLFKDYGESACYTKFVKCHERDGKLYMKSKKDGQEHVVAKQQIRDDYEIYEYVDQHCRYEDAYYGTIYTMTPIRNVWLERHFDS